MRMKLIKLALLTTACSTAVGAYAADVSSKSAAAEGGLEEIVVTAQKREEAAQRVPIALTAISAEQLAVKGITSFDGIAATTPSIAFVPYPNSSNTLILFMRGQGTADSGRINAEGAVGLYEDGFYIARPQGATLDLADVQRVEVLRGPQGTLYGRNTTGGAVNIVSKAPTGEFGLKETLDFGNFDGFRSLTAINLPSWGDLSAKVNVVRSSTDGYVRNAGSSNDYGLERQTGGKLQLRWDITPDLRADFFTEVESLEDTPPYFENPSLQGLKIGNYVYNGATPLDTTYRPVDLPLSHTTFQGNGLTLSWQPNDELTVKSLTGYHQLLSGQNQDYAESIVAAPSFPLGYVTYDRYRQRQFSQELQATGDLFDKSVQYTAGLYFFTESGSWFNRQTITTPTYPSPATILDQLMHFTTTSKAIYGQATWMPDAVPGMELTIGARYSSDSQDADRFASANGFVIENGVATGDAPSTSSSKFTPSATLNYHWTPDVSTYAKVTTGYRGGGLFAAAPLGAFDKSAFGPEELTSYEIGIKSEWLDNHVRANIAAYRSDFNKIQVGYDTDPTNPAFELKQNAGKATLQGVEIELAVVPVENLTISVNYAYLDSRLDRIDVLPGTLYDHSANSASPFKVGDNIASLFSLQHNPRNSFDISGDYAVHGVMDGDVSLHLDYRWQGHSAGGSDAGTAFANNVLETQPSFGYLDGRLTWARTLAHGSEITFGIWAKNLTNERYQNATFGLKYGPFPADGGFYNQFVAYAPPRMYGVTLAYEY